MVITMKETYLRLTNVCLKLSIMINLNVMRHLLVAIAFAYQHCLVIEGYEKAKQSNDRVD